MHIMDSNMPITGKRKIETHDFSIDTTVLPHTSTNAGIVSGMLVYNTGKRTIGITLNIIDTIIRPIIISSQYCIILSIEAVATGSIGP
jgi:hypothetical protein